MRNVMIAVLVAAATVLTWGSKDAAAQQPSCWGQATAVFAHMGELGAHSSQQEEPRLGLANLARALYEAGVLDEPTIAALGAFVAVELGLDIQACETNHAAVVAAERAVDVEAACWGQASKVFAEMGLMGEHASQQPNPRLGLRNLARALADAGVLVDDSMASLGGFVASELGLEIDACM